MKALQNRRFHKPVLVQPGRIDRDLVVCDTRTAADVLLRRWPNETGPLRLKAMQYCLEAMKGVKPPARARHAFIEAAREARILLD